MKNKSLSFIIAILFIAITIWATSAQRKLPIKLYSIDSIQDYDYKICDAEKDIPGLRSGALFILTDKISGKQIEGDVVLYTKNSVTMTTGYYCAFDVTDNRMVVAAYAKGYTPAVFNLQFIKNKLFTVTVPMVKSCTGGQNYFDTVDLINQIQDEPIPNDELIKGEEAYVYDIIKEKFNLDKTDYTLSCIEGRHDKGGYIKAKGTLADGSPLELYYEDVVGSSGNGIFNESKCISSTLNNVFETVKNNTCNDLSSSMRGDDNLCSSSQKSFDNSAEVQNECKNGKYESIQGDKKTFSLTQNSSRCSSSVEVLSFNCLEN